MDWIKGYEGLYKINREGEIWSERRPCSPGKFLKIPIQKNNYKMVKLCKNNNQSRILLHRLLAIQYIPNPDNNLWVDHINRNSMDNRLENLRWVSPLENAHNRTINKNNKTGHAKIKYSPKGRFVARVTYKGRSVSKTFILIEDAIEWRDKTLTQLKNNTYITPPQNNSGHTGIYITDTNLFRASVNYNNKKYQQYYKTLEEAISWREETLAVIRKK